MVFTLDTYPVGGHYPMVRWGSDHFPNPPALNPVKDGGTGWSSSLGGVPVDGSVFPKRVDWDEAPDNPPPDFDSMPTINVSERAKRIIEQLEPETHQFFPVEYHGRDGNRIETRYWLVICNRIDSIHPTLSNMVMNPRGVWAPPKDAVRRGWPLPSHVDPAAPGSYVIDSDKIAGVHFWRDKHSAMALMSEAAWRALQDASMMGLNAKELAVA